jgi:hypothetical protein
MGYIIDIIRSWFCNHEWECLMEKAPVYEDFYTNYPAYFQWVYVCKKCKRTKIIKSNGR